MALTKEEALELIVNQDTTIRCKSCGVFVKNVDKNKIKPTRNLREYWCIGATNSLFNHHCWCPIRDK